MVSNSLSTLDSMDFLGEGMSSSSLNTSNSSPMSLVEDSNALLYFGEDPDLLEDILPRSPNPTSDLMLTQASSLLGISRFELKLVDFFNRECINLLSFGVNRGVQRTWEFEVPHIFLQSELLRQSIFSFSAIGLMTTLNIGIDELYYQDNNDIAQLQLSHKSARDYLFTKTTDYFMNALAETTKSVALGPNISPLRAKELFTSSILIFAYLGIHPHKLLPLISFSRTETDLISITKGMRTVFVECVPIIARTELHQLLLWGDNQEIISPPHNFKSSPYPIIKTLRDDLYALVGNSSLDLETMDKIEIYKSGIEFLNKALFECMHFKFPIPLYRWVLLLPNEFRELLYIQDEFTLRLLFIFSCLCSICRFQLYDENNMWNDYVEWYVNGYKRGYLGDTGGLDACLYELAMVKKFRFDQFDSIGHFDPVVEFGLIDAMI